MREAFIYKGVTMYIIYPDTDIRHHYWARANGMIYSSERNMEVPADDEEYQAWLAAGGLPTAYPKDKNGNESVAELDAVLAPYDLRASSTTAEEQRRLAFEIEADPLLDRGLSYREEAAAWRRAGVLERATEADEWSNNAFDAYLKAKEKIRARFPLEVK